MPEILELMALGIFQPALPSKLQLGNADPLGFLGNNGTFKAFPPSLEEERQLFLFSLPGTDGLLLEEGTRTDRSFALHLGRF